MVTNFENIVRIKKTKKDKPIKTEFLKYIEEAKALIIDECHLSYTPKLQKVWSQFKSIGYKIGLSGTPKPDHTKPIELEAFIGPIVCKVHFDKLIEIGRIATPYVYIYDLPIAWYQRWVSSYSDYYEINIVRNVLRNNFIAHLVATLPDKTILIAVNKRYHGDLLNALIPNSVYINGDVDSDIRKEYYTLLDSGKLKCIIATVGKVGLNIPNLDIVINAEGLAATTATIQKMRSLTAAEGKNCGIIIDFIDKQKYLAKHSYIRINQYEAIKGFNVQTIVIKPDFFEKEKINDS